MRFAVQPGEVADTGTRSWNIGSAFAFGVMLLANLVPLYGAIFEHWSVLNILLIYWAENVIVGVVTVLEMGTVSATSTSAAFTGIPVIVFFCVHYAFFTTGHGALIYSIFGHGQFPHGAIRHDYWHSFYEPFTPGHALFYPVLSICVARFNSFVSDFLGRGEYRAVSIGVLMLRPYGRVMLLHVVLLVGGFLAMLAGSPWVAVAVLVLTKTAIELALHGYMRRYGMAPQDRETQGAIRQLQQE